MHHHLKSIKHNQLHCVFFPPDGENKVTFILFEFRDEKKGFYVFHIQKSYLHELFNKNIDLWDLV